MGDNPNQHKEAIIRYNRILTFLHEFNIRMTEMIPSSQDFGWIIEIVYKIFPQAHTVSLQLSSETAELVTKWVDRHHSVENPIRFSNQYGIAGYAIAQKRVINVPDVQKDTRYVKGNFSANYRSLLVAPLITNTGTLGTISITALSIAGFDTQDEIYIDMLARQIAVLIHRAEIYIQEQEQRIFANKLSEIITRLTYTSNLDNLFVHVLNSINDVIANDGATIALLKDEKTIYFAGVSGSVLETNPSLKEQLIYWEEIGTWQTMMQTRAPLLIRDTKNSELWQVFFNNDWIYSHVGSPIIDENQQVIGFINLDSHQPNQFDEQDAERLKIFADHLATVIQKTRLLETEHNQREIAETLREIGLVVANLLKPDAILLAILEHLKRVVEYKTACIWFLDEAGHWEEQIGHDYEGTVIENQDKQSSKINLQDIFKLTETSLEVTLASVSLDDESSIFSNTDLQSVAVTPIILREKITGALVLWHTQPNFYTEYHSPILRTLATHLAIAIDNARLYVQQEAAHDEIRFYAKALEQLVRERTEALDKERIKLNTILQEIGEGVMVIERIPNNEAEVHFVNNMFCKMLGVEVEDIKNREFRHIVEEFVPSVYYSQLLHQFSLGEITETNSKYTDLVIQRKNGTSFDAQISFTLANLENEETWLGILLVRDISKQRNLQKQRERFLANASHELRTPLTNLNTRFYLMRHQPEKLDAHLDVVERTTLKMTSLVNDLLDLMRANQREASPTLVRCDIQDTLGEVYDTQLAEAEMKDIQFTLKILDKPLYILAQSKHLDQIFTNLVSNAILYTPQGGEIRIVCELVNKNAVVSITDTGIGIPAEFTEAIFEPFARVNVDELGTGLGLAIVQEFVDVYAGKIWVESEIGQGTTFYVQLPTLDHLINPD